MKFHQTMAALLCVLAMHALRADEPKDTAATENTAITPSAETATIAASEPASKPRKTPTSTATRKVATDYAPAQDLLLSAMSLIGVKYKWGGNTPESGLDCSGFIRYVFQNTLNIALPRTALGMSRMGGTIDKGELKPGDLVFFNTLKRQFSHVGIYLGDNRFIHSPRSGRNVEVANMGDKYWTSRFDGARRMSELDHENVDIQALLQNRPARVSSQATAPAENQNCRKVTSTRKGKKITTTVCSNKPAAAKPAATKLQSKTSKASKQAKTTPKASSKKPASYKKKKN